MEKRNFVTPLRTVEASTAGDELINDAAALFGAKNGNFGQKMANFDQKTADFAEKFEKKAREEDEKSDSLC